MVECTSPTWVRAHIASRSKTKPRHKCRIGLTLTHRALAQLIDDYRSKTLEAIDRNAYDKGDYWHDVNDKC
jgi:hypothetical protein